MKYEVGRVIRRQRGEGTFVESKVYVVTSLAVACGFATMQSWVIAVILSKLGWVIWFRCVSYMAMLCFCLLSLRQLHFAFIYICLLMLHGKNIVDVVMYVIYGYLVLLMNLGISLELKSLK